MHGSGAAFYISATVLALFVLGIVAGFVGCVWLFCRAIRRYL